MLERMEYFEDIPWEFRNKLVTQFLYRDIFERPSFKSFFDTPQEIESSFAYEVAFGFMPRHYQPTEEDRYMIEEEGDVTEITFIVNGVWAIAFNTYVIHPEEGLSIQEEDDDTVPRDMIVKGHYIAMQYNVTGYIGDYYVLTSKRSRFHYVALSPLDTYALPKRFLSEKIFRKYPELERVMISDAFAKYVNQIRKPCTKIRLEKIAQLNQSMLFSQIQPSNIKNFKHLINDVNGTKNKFKNKPTTLEQNCAAYAAKIEDFNQMARQMHQKAQSLHALFS
jgi:hypothetical protein